MLGTAWCDLPQTGKSSTWFTLKGLPPFIYQQCFECNLGIQYANGKAYRAGYSLGSVSIGPRNPQARFQRATIYSALHRPDALQELIKVRDAAPREATVPLRHG
jgi:hypothetical protein